MPADLEELWSRDGDVRVVRLDEDDERPLGTVLDDPAAVTSLISLGVPTTGDCVDALENVEEAAVVATGYEPDAAAHEALADRGVDVYFHDSGGFWGQSVAEHALGLTIGAMRRIPLKHHAITESYEHWDRDRWERGADDGFGGVQGTDDDPVHTTGTVAGTRFRAAGVGNIGSRYLDYVATLGADVAAYDPYADDPAFHRTGVRRVHRLDALLDDAEVFAPLLPPTEETRGLIDADRVARLPEGCLVVLVTRASVVDVDALRERVLADELALAADVFDEEPLPLDDPLLGRENVVHTPHVAGRTRDANREWARMLLARFADAPTLPADA